MKETNVRGCRKQFTPFISVIMAREKAYPSERPSQVGGCYCTRTDAAPCHYKGGPDRAQPASPLAPGAAAALPGAQTRLICGVSRISMPAWQHPPLPSPWPASASGTMVRWPPSTPCSSQPAARVTPFMPASPGGASHDISLGAGADTVIATELNEGWWGWARCRLHDRSRRRDRRRWYGGRCR